MRDGCQIELVITEPLIKFNLHARCEKVQIL